jgi:hypothetical protein
MEYENGKIYKLECEDGHFYYGSTITELRKRLYRHKRASEKQPYRVYQHINTIGWDKVKIVLVENFPCKTKKELNQKENEYILSHKDNELCLNTIVAFHTEETRKIAKKQYYERTIEERREYERKRNQTEHRKEQKRQRILKEATENREEYLTKKREEYLRNKEKRDAKNKENYYKNREEVLRKKKERYHSSRINI